MPSVINQLVVGELAQKLRELDNALVVDFTGVNGPQSVALREMLRQLDGRMLVVKNSLARLALRRAHREGLDRALAGPCALVFGADPVVLSKALREWGKKEQRPLACRGALLAGRVLSAQEAQALATLPPLGVLRAQVVVGIAAPLSAFVGVLQAVVRSFVCVVKAIAEKNEGGGGESQRPPSARDARAAKGGTTNG